MSETPILACDIFAMTSDQRARHAALAQRFRDEARLEELPDGYAFVFEPDEERALELAEFMALERRCCPFLHLAVEFLPSGGPLRLRLTGAPGVKPFLVNELGLTQETQV